MKKILYSLLVIAIVVTSISALSAQNNKHYKVEKILKIGGMGRWDYLAVHKNYLYISHGNQVNVVNKNNGAPISIISGTTGVHGIAFVPELNKGFISDGRIDSVTVFDLSTNKVLSKIATGKDPDAIMYDDYSKKIITCDGHSNGLSVIDPITEKVVATIDLGGKPETAVSDNAGKLYVNIENKSQIAEVDLKTNQVLNHWSLSPAESPSGLAFDTKTERLFAGCDNNLLVVMDATNGKIVTTLPIGSGCDGVAFDAKSKHIFSSNGEDGNITIIKEKSKDNFVVEQNLITKKGARTIALDEETHKIYLPTADFETNKTVGKRPTLIPDTFQVLVVEDKL